MASEYEYPPENKGLYPPGSYGYKMCELAERCEDLKQVFKESTPKWLYKLIFIFYLNKQTGL